MSQEVLGETQPRSTLLMVKLLGPLRAPKGAHPAPEKGMYAASTVGYGDLNAPSVLG